MLSGTEIGDSSSIGVFSTWAVMAAILLRPGQRTVTR